MGALGNLLKCYFLSRVYRRQTVSTNHARRHLFFSRWHIIGLFLSLIGTSFEFVLSHTPGRIYGLDDIYYFIYLPSLVVDGDLDFANQIGAFRSYRDDGILDEIPTGSGGRVLNRYGIGYALLSLPFFLLGFPLTFLVRLFGIPWNYDGMNPLFQFSTTVASVVWGFVGLALCQRLLLSHFPSIAARRSTAMIFAATPLLYYICLTPTMAHATAFFSVALWFYLWDRRDPKLPAWQAMALGASGALAFMVRYPNLLIWIGALVDWPRWHGQRPAGANFSHWLRFWLIAAGSFGICILPQLGVWQVLYGQAIVNTYPALSKKFSLADGADIWALLFSDMRGLFNWHPVLLLAAVGLIVSVRSHRWLALNSLLVLSSLTYLYASYHLRTFGVSFGNRVFVDALPFFSVGLAVFLMPGRWVAFRWGICWVLTVLNLAVAVSYRSHAIPGLEAFSWPKRILAVVDVPEQIFAGLGAIMPKLKPAP